MLTAEIQNFLLSRNNGLTLFIMVGNAWRTDDGVGCYLAGKLASSAKYVILNAEDKPENILTEAIDLKPARTVIADAADFQGVPGEIRIISSDNIPETSLSTHSIPLKVLAKLIEKDTRAPVYFLGIQPKSLQFGEGLSPEVKETADGLICFINKNNN